jgi:hypothetical protein
MLRMFLAALALASLAGCGTTPVKVGYRPEANVNPFPASSARVSAATFVDDRGEPPRWLGAIRGGFGNPLKVLETDETVAVIVQKAFDEGIRARRGSPAQASGALEIRGNIKKLDCSQYVRREAHGVIEVAVVEVATGRERFRRTYTADAVDGSIVSLSTGIFASVDDLRGVAEQVVKQLVDKALDDPSLRDALRT